jgi:DNA processing protein
MALDLNREVLAIPGSIHATQSHGCHALIRQGAKLVESAQDVLEELQLSTQQQVNLFNDALGASDGLDIPAPTSIEHPLLTHMGFAPVTLDALQARSGLDTAPLQAQLLTLELDGQVGRLAGGLFQRLAAT